MSPIYSFVSTSTRYLSKVADISIDDHLCTVHYAHLELYELDKHVYVCWLFVAKYNNTDKYQA